MVVAASIVVSIPTGGCAALVVGGVAKDGTYEATEEAGARSEHDRQLGVQVRDRFSGESELRNADIEVTVSDGVVTLTGIVEDFGERSQAEVLAAGVRGVRGIHNRLKVAETY